MRVEIAYRIKLFDAGGAESWRRLRNLPRAAFGSALAHAGIGIALIDSGIDRHADLPTRVLYTKDYVDPQGSGADGHGHGTHIAGIMTL